MKVISIVQRKGGVAKSTSCLNLACVLAEAGNRVLIVDLDDQQNSTNSISGPGSGELTVADLLLSAEVDINAVLTSTDWANVWMLPAAGNLSGVAKHLDSEVGGHLVLGERLQNLKDIDYVLIDTSPSLNILVLGAMCASNYLFIPLSSRFFSLQGLTKTLEAYSKVKKRLNPDLVFLGMGFMIHDQRNTLAREIVQRVRGQYPSYLLETMIGTNIKIEEAQVNKQSIVTYAPSDRGAQQYRALGRELLRRIGQLETAPAGAAHG